MGTRRRLGEFAESLTVYGRLTIGAIAGALVTWASGELIPEAGVRVALGLMTTIAVALIGDSLVEPERRRCRRETAEAARSLLDRRLEVGFVDRFQSGRWLTLRGLAAAAAGGTLAKELAAGTDSYSLSQTLAGFAEAFRNEVALCYGRLRSSGQAKVDAFVACLNDAAGAAAALSTIGPSLADDDETRGRRRDLYEPMGRALVAVAAAGDAIDVYGDSRGAARESAARLAREQAEAAAAGRNLEILIANARTMLDTFGSAPITEPVTQELVDRIRAARDVGLHVDAAAYHDARNGDRDAHHRVTYGDLFEALESAQRLLDDRGEPEDATKMHTLLERLPADLAKLEALARPTS